METWTAANRRDNRRICRECQKAVNANWCAANKSRALETTRKRQKRYPEKCADATKRWYQNNKREILERGAKKRKLFSPEEREKYKARAKKWSQENSGLRAASLAARRARLKRAIPAWANLEEIKQIYREAEILGRASLVRWDVDHVIPIKNDLVCGLHVETNLKVILAIDNRVKGNKFIPY